MSIKAIETHYKGYRFRSRLEARWAVFFDALGIKWEYEREGYNLDGNYYLPDFWLPFRGEPRPYPEGIPPIPGFYVEIKPAKLSDQEERLCRLLAANSGHCVYAAAGNIGRGEFISYKWHPKSTSTYIQTELNEMKLNYLLSYLIFDIVPMAPTEFYDFAKIDPAFDAARSARFEHDSYTGPKRTYDYSYDDDEDEKTGECDDCGRAIKERFTYCYTCNKRYE